jgi:hypothetical protein
MSAQTQPIITAPVPTLPLPIGDWQRGQTVGQFLDALSRRFVPVQTSDGLRMVWKH